MNLRIESRFLNDPERILSQVYEKARDIPEASGELFGCVRGREALAINRRCQYR